MRGLKGITLNYEGPDFTNSYWMTTVVIDPEYGLDKQKLMEEMLPHGILAMLRLATRDFTK